MITISKIAALAHVSVSTASKAFSGSREVNEKTRKLIFDIAKQHGAFKKFYNAKYPQIVIAVVIPEYHSGNYGVLISEIQKELNARDCTMTVTAADFLLEKNEALLDYYSNYTSADGIILVDGNITIPDSFATPHVTIGEKESATSPHISVNLDGALLDAIEHFKNNGVPSVGFISEEKTSSKLSAFRRAMNKIYGSCDESFISISDSRFEEGGYEATENLIKKGKLPRAIVCGYDNIAYGAMRAIADHKLSVPHDVAIVSFDDMPTSKYTVPALSGIGIKRAECARIATDMILGMILGTPHEKNVTLNADLKLRESTEILRSSSKKED